MNTTKTVTILGDGSWGTTLAWLLAGSHPVAVRLWGPFPQDIEAIVKDGENKKYLPDVKLPQGVEPEADLKKAITETNLIIIAIPTQYLRPILRQLAKIGLPTDLPILSASKGIEVESLKRISEMVVEEIGNNPFTVLSGPTIARDVIRKMPTIAVLASKDKALAKSIKSIIETPEFKLELSGDVIGVELGGSLKNVVAVACGLSEGIGASDKERQKIITEGLAEVQQLALKLGAKSRCFTGPSWHGDLLATCSSKHSRNRQIGCLIGQGHTLEMAKGKMPMIAEGPETIKSTYFLAKREGLALPLVEILYNILFDGKPAGELRQIINK